MASRYRTPPSCPPASTGSDVGRDADANKAGRPPCELDGGCPLINHCARTAVTCSAFRQYANTGNPRMVPRGRVLWPLAAMANEGD